MNSWNQDIYLKAWNFASMAHQGQKIPSADIAYINHIGLVTMEGLAAIAVDSKKCIKDPDLLVQCALLHDTIEDTDITYNDIEEAFGTAVADGVMALSKDQTLPTKTAQMQDSLERILLQPKEVWMVKLADRITNLQPPPPHWNLQKTIRYHDEAVIILKTLGSANPHLQARLALKIEQYQKYLQAT